MARSTSNTLIGLLLLMSPTLVWTTKPTSTLVSTTKPTSNSAWPTKATFEEFNGETYQAEDGSGDIELLTTGSDLSTVSTLIVTGPDEDKSANGTVRYNENVTAITESSTKPSHETIRYKTSLSSDNHTLTYDDVTGYTPQYGTHYDLSSTQTTKTEPNTTAQLPMDEKLALYISLGTLMSVIIFITLAFLWLMFKYHMNMRTLLGVMRTNIRSVVTCKYRIAADSNTKSSTKKGYMLSTYEPSYIDNHDSDSDDDYGEDNNSCIIATESVQDISNQANEESQEIIIYYDDDDDDDDIAVPSSPVPSEEYIKNFLINNIDQQLLRNEFDIIRKWSKQLPFSKLHAKLDKNRGKNRYYDIIPFDYNRVPLYDKPGIKGLVPYRSMALEEMKEMRYINASFIHASPLSGTISDFWEMVWQEESDMIIMLTSLREQGKAKCERYWPDESGTSINCREISVKLDVMQHYAYHDYRRLEITKTDAKRLVHHHQYHHWPDKAAPEMVLPILNLYRKAFIQGMHKTGPVITHCSAGVGRTGTFISLDYIQEQANKTNTVDILGCVAELRRQRVNMVQRLSQYVFLYEAIHEALEVGPTVIPAAKFSSWLNEVHKEKDNIILKHFKFMNAKRPTRPPDNELVGLEAENKEKNRDLNILPDYRKIAYLSTFMKGRNAYVNAVYVDTFRETNAVIVTQLPLKDTICDFWRLVYDSSSSTVVLLEDMVGDQFEDCPKYWPENGEEVIYGGVMAVSGHIDKGSSTSRITVRNFHVVTKPQCNYSLDVKMFHLNTWSRGQRLPPGKSDLIELIQMTQKHKKNVSVIQCLNGCEKSGIFCACMYIMDQIQIDQEVDIYQASRIITASRSQFIRTEEEYRYLHEFALECLKRPEIRYHSISAFSTNAVQKRKSGKYSKESLSARRKSLKHQTKSVVGAESIGLVSSLIKRRPLYRSENEINEAAKTEPISNTPAANSSRQKIKPKLSADIFRAKRRELLVDTSKVGQRSSNGALTKQQADGRRSTMPCGASADSSDWDVPLAGGCSRKCETVPTQKEPTVNPNPKTKPKKGFIYKNRLL
ncbi:hypothetical protein LSH36_16g06028 [Paralvinella palmiformis]|uniref:protein-tyrosine-phosphatase n=1 Tax=Paralvinella palmiformis TaxID=53620 RepID=A0AAD9NHJ7_9ANNE|nr:hypothetical protein LSH36_16g06028 [Paralvinella palmiformis]